MAKVRYETDEVTDNVSVGIAEQFRTLAISVQALESISALNADFKRIHQSVQRELLLRQN